ncbi:MAG: hypothetical protein ABI870_12350, partial [Rhodanobacter sp.]
MKLLKTLTRPQAIAMAVCAIFTFSMQSALAVTCPPGYASKGPGCVPTPPHPYHPRRGVAEHVNAHASPTANPLRHEPAELHKQADWHKLKPQPGAPIEHASSASQKHGIIFVGGKKAIHSQPVARDHAALNPQPIPPGHSLRKMPHPGA